MSFLTKILPFLLPLALLLLWIWWYKRKHGVLANIREAPWYGLALLGLISFVVLVLFIRLQSQGDPEGNYYPATLNGGEIKPGRIERK